MIRGRVFWGGLFILAGGLLLMSNFGLLPFSLRQIFWPLMLILAGVWVLYRSFSGEKVEVEQYSLGRESAERVQMKIEHAAGRIALGSGAPAGQLVSGSFVGGVRSRVSRNGAEASVKLSVPSDSWLNLPFGPSGGFAWDVQLSPEVVYELKIETAAGELWMDLSELQVESLKLSTGASSTTATLPSKMAHGRVKVESGAATVKLNVPEGVAARIRTESGLAQVTIDQDRFPQRGGVHESPDYDTAEHKLDINIETGVASVAVN